MANSNKAQEYSDLLNQIKYLTNFTEKDTDKIINEVVKKGIGCKAELIKQEYRTGKEPELKALQNEVLKAYYNLMKKTIFQKDLDQYKCEKSYSAEAKNRVVKTANQKVEQLTKEVSFRDMSADEVKIKATEEVNKLEQSKRYLGEVLKSGEGIAKVDNIHKMFENYVGINDAVNDWVRAEKIKAAKEVATNVARTIFGVLVEVGTLTSNALKDFSKECEVNKSKMVNEWREEIVTANKDHLKRQLHSAITYNDRKKVDEINEELKAYNSLHGRDRYEDVRFL